MKTKLSSFDFKLPEKLIAKYPAKERDESRLMVVHKDSGKIEHKVFKDLIDYFDENDTLIFNNTKVFPARLFGKKEKTGAQIEVFLLRELNKESKLWDVLVDPARKIRVGNNYTLQMMTVMMFLLQRWLITQPPGEEPSVFSLMVMKKNTEPL
jgi:S-adenosylmethionine:tRNA ribosyltransferase-isomerase